MSNLQSETLNNSLPLSKRGRPKGPSGKVCRDAKVTFRCTPEEKEALTIWARHNQLTLGDWLRIKLFDA